MSEIPQIGKCSGCQRTARVRNLACEACRACFGEQSGPIFQMVRDDNEFAVLCFRAANQNQRWKFAQIFGVPKGCEGT